MSTVIKIIIEILKAIFSNSKQRADRDRAAEDRELAEAIRNGDSETVGKIRERRRKYPNL